MLWSILCKGTINAARKKKRETIRERERMARGKAKRGRGGG